MAFDEEELEEIEERQPILIDQFECVDAFIEDQDAYDNAMISLQNSNVSTYSKMESSFGEEDPSTNPKTPKPQNPNNFVQLFF